MRLTFTQYESFVVEWRRLKLTDLDLQALEKLLIENPAAGVVLGGTGGLRKVRFAPPSWHTGKSGATRVCYVLIAEAAQCFLFDIFTKNEKPNLSAADKAQLRKLVEKLKRRVS